MKNRKQQLENLLNGVELKYLPAYGHQYVNKSGNDHSPGNLPADGQRAYLHSTRGSTTDGAPMIYRKLGNHWYTLVDLGVRLISFKSQMDAKRFKYVHVMYEKQTDEVEKQRLLTLMQSMHW